MRLTDRKTTAELKANADSLRALGFEPSILDRRYIKLAEYEDAEELIKPTADVEPVKHGRWIYGENEDGQDGIFCSECDHFVPWYYDYYDKTDDLINDNPRCPNCGAKMGGD